MTFHEATGVDFDKFYTTYQPKLKAFLKKNFQRTNTEVIEDCITDSFIKVWKNIHNYNGDKGSVVTYLTQIAINDLRYQERRRIKMPTVSIDLFYDICEEIEEEDTTNERYIQMIKKIDRIKNPKIREAVILKDVQGIPYLEMEEITGANGNTLRSRVKKGRKLLTKKN